MSNALSLVYEGVNVRTMMVKNEPWWWLTDICKILELSNPSMIVQRLDDDEIMTLSNTEGQTGMTLTNSYGQKGGAQFFNLVNEPGLYHVILTSRSPKAKPFRRWVTHELLPSVRKTGVYSTSVYALFNGLEDANISIPSVSEPLTQATRAYREHLSGQMFLKCRDQLDEMDYSTLMSKLWHKDANGMSESLINYRKYRKLTGSPFSNYTEQVYANAHAIEEAVICPQLIEPMTKSEAQEVFNQALPNAPKEFDTKAYIQWYSQLGIPHQFDQYFSREWRKRLCHK